VAAVDAQATPRVSGMVRNHPSETSAARNPTRVPRNSCQSGALLDRSHQVCIEAPLQPVPSCGGTR
jgi:hypothetical protein